MPYPQHLLNQGEAIVLDRRPHPWFMAEVIGGVVGSLVLLLALVILDAPGFLITGGLVVVVIAGLAFAGRYAQWVTTQFVITTDRVVYRSGLLTKNGIEIPLENVTNIISRQTIFERMLGSGDLTIQSAGQDGDQRFSDVAKPFVVQNIVHAERERAQARDRAGIGASSAPAAVSVADELKKLADLRDGGVISEEEFTAQKARLLDQ